MFICDVAPTTWLRRKRGMRVFSREELAEYNGKNGNPSYIAFKGKVYDVSASFLWKDGRHQVFHIAGEDLTDALGQAPHGVETLEKFPVVGIFHGVGMTDK